MATRIQMWETGECRCKIIMAYNTDMVKPEDDWESHYAHFAILPSFQLPDGSVERTSICPAHQGISPFDILETCHIEHKKVAHVIRHLRANVAGLQDEERKNSLSSPIVTIWSGVDKNRVANVRLNLAFKGRGLVNVSHLRAAKADVEKTYGPGSVVMDEQSV